MIRMSSKLLLLFVLASISVFAQPKLEIEGGRTYDWGEVKQKDSPLKAKIKIKNIGDKVLDITKVKPGCGCTTAPLDNDKIQPNEYATLDVTLNVSHYSGQITKSIRVESNDPENPRYYIMLKANVITPLLAVPHFLSFNTININEEATAQIKLKNTTDKDMTIKQLTIKPEDLKINLDEGTVIPSKGTIKLIAKYTGKEAGRFRGSVIIKADHPDVTRYIINCWGNVLDPSEGVNKDPNNVVVPPKKK